MPLYDYECTCCKAVVEKLSPWTKTVIDCPKCGGGAIRMVSAHAKTASAWEVNKVPAKE